MSVQLWFLVVHQRSFTTIIDDGVAVHDVATSSVSADITGHLAVTKKVTQRQGKIILTVELLPSDRCVLALGKFVLRVDMSDEPSDPSPCTWKRKHAVAA